MYSAKLTLATKAKCRQRIDCYKQIQLKPNLAGTFIATFFLLNISACRRRTKDRYQYCQIVKVTVSVLDMKHLEPSYVNIVLRKPRYKRLVTIIYPRPQLEEKKKLCMKGQGVKKIDNFPHYYSNCVTPGKWLVLLSYTEKIISLMPD